MTRTLHCTENIILKQRNHWQLKFQISQSIVKHYFEISYHDIVFCLAEFLFCIQKDHTWVLLMTARRKTYIKIRFIRQSRDNTDFKCHLKLVVAQISVNILSSCICQTRTFCKYRQCSCLVSLNCLQQNTAVHYQLPLDFCFL